MGKGMGKSKNDFSTRIAFIISDGAGRNERLVKTMCCYKCYISVEYKT